MFLHTTHQNSTCSNLDHTENMDGLLNTLKSIRKMSVAFITKFTVAMQNQFIRCGGCSIIIFFYNSSVI